jgi:DNA repair protein REV1
VASNLTPKKRVEFERYKVVRPEWIVDCVKAGKALPWNQYRLIDQSSQKTIGFAPRYVENYKAVSSRDEKVMYGGSGLQNEPSPEKSSYPTPPEMNSMELNELEQDIKVEQPNIASPSHLTSDQQYWGSDQDIELPSNISPFHVSPPKLGSSTIESSKQGIGREQSEDDVLASIQQSIGLPSTTASPQLSSPSKFVTEQPENDQQPPILFGDVAAKSAAHNTALLANPSLRSSTVVDPNFLKTYFGQSRLHHLSAWKADLKNQMQSLMSQRPQHPKRPGFRCIMHVDFDCFFCSVSLVSRPDLKDKPVCVGHGGAKSGEISSCNYPARKFGIHNGMRLFQTPRLANDSMGRGLELCKDLVCLPYDFPAYEQASRDFYDILLSVNADATQVVSVDEALLDVSSVCAGDPETLAHSIRDRVREKTQCDVSIGIGENVLLAKLALRKAKPAGQYHLKMDEIHEFMENLDVRDLPGVGWKLSEKLEEVMNIRTVGELRLKSMNELKGKFGPKTGEKLYDFARGIDATEVGGIIERKSVSVEVNVFPLLMSLIQVGGTV